MCVLIDRGDERKNGEFFSPRPPGFYLTILLWLHPALDDQSGGQPHSGYFPAERLRRLENEDELRNPRMGLNACVLLPCVPFLEE